MMIRIMGLAVIVLILAGCSSIQSASGVPVSTTDAVPETTESQFELRVNVDFEACEAYGLSSSDVLAFLQDLKSDDPETVANTVILSHPGGDIKVGDIAEVILVPKTSSPQNY